MLSNFSDYWWKLSVFFLTGCGILGPQATLNRSWPVKYGFGTELSTTPVREGYILTKKDDTLRGYIKMATVYEVAYTITAIPILPFNKKSKSDLLEVKLADIDYVRIQNTLKSKITEDYMPVNSAMWQVLGSKGPVKVCYRQVEADSLSSGYSRRYDQMLLLTGKWIIVIPMIHTGLFQSRLDLLLEFINDRYRKSFQRADFKDQNDMINYILNNEKEGADLGIPGQFYPQSVPE
jgi:hypothetical protein